MALIPIKFTKRQLDSLKVPAAGRDYYKDSNPTGLCLYVTANGARTFFIRKRVNGRDEKIVLGAFPDLSVENAIKMADGYRGQIAAGTSPSEAKRASRQEQTFGAFFVEYMERYSKKHKRSWVYDEREVNKFLKHWFQRKLSGIKRHEVQALHQKIGDQNGLYQANRLLERVRAIYNKAIEWGWKGENPAAKIKKFKERERDRFMDPAELKLFVAALQKLKFPETRDYFMLSLLTGARKSNMLAMRWDEINWDLCTWRIPQTKNGEALTLPLSSYAMEVLTMRRNAYDAPSDFETDAMSQVRLTKRQSPWVFPNPITGMGHLTDPKNAWRSLMHETGLKDLRIHDLRRTLGSIQAINGASLTIIGKSLGHKSQKATSIYARLNLDPVRASVQAAGDVMVGMISKQMLGGSDERR